MALGIFGEPAFEDSGFLLEHFKDAPEAGECHGTEDSCPDQGGHAKRYGSEYQANNQEYPPALLAEFVFHFYDERVAHSD